MVALALSLPLTVGATLVLFLYQQHDQIGEDILELPYTRFRTTNSPSHLEGRAWWKYV
jgi:hypothetical protein